VKSLSFIEIDIPAFIASSPDIMATYRFAMADCGYLPNDIAVTAADIETIDYQPSILSLGQDMGTRAVVTITFRDHRHMWDPTAGGGLGDFQSGSMWGKFRARYGLKLRGYNLRMLRGSLGQSLDQMETRHFIIDATDGPSADGKFKIIAKDMMKFADGDRAQAPLISPGFLSADITNVATSFTLSPTGAGAS
jgi:hypothetical protein